MHITVNINHKGVSYPIVGFGELEDPSKWENGIFAWKAGSDEKGVPLFEGTFEVTGGTGVIRAEFDADESAT